MNPEIFHDILCMLEGMTPFIEAAHRMRERLQAETQGCEFFPHDPKSDSFRLKLPHPRMNESGHEFNGLSVFYPHDWGTTESAEVARINIKSTEPLKFDIVYDDDDVGFIPRMSNDELVAFVQSKPNGTVKDGN